MCDGKKLRFGIIGPGSIARKFCRAAERSGVAEIAAAASRTPGKAEAFAGEFGIESAYEGYEEMLARPDIEAVYISTTHNFHYENILAALNAGKHVICEKAMVLTRAQAEAVFALAKERKCYCMEAMWSRFLPAVQRARAWVQEGRIGQVEMANCVIGFLSAPDAENRIRNPKLAGGAMYDIGVYAIEITDYLIRETLREVTSVTTRMETGVDKVDNLTLRYDNCVANLQVIVTAPTDSFLDLFGTKGRIRIPQPVTAQSCAFYGADGAKEEYTAPEENGFVYEIRDMVRCVREGRITSDVIPPEDTIQCAGIFDKVLSTK